ncbi:ATP-binding/permease protein CydD [Geobacter sp. OR-1]|uniref:thiol reductant ABC exporter subunit CydD n=1 Tax=Geobacter sp. OR-1 TaxID=1266765 RepID=UPI0005436326|nr:thiol reductant ABC exporter subunit CydD [Geobacter sp. OR-1]GAM10731.1 ATP-binding/permease protein CydD [Geobacter sp. OR-1]
MPPTGESLQRPKNEQDSPELPIKNGAMTTPIRENPAMEPEQWLRREAREVLSPLAAAVVLGVAAGILIIVQARLLAGACHDLIINGAGWQEIPAVAGTLALLALLRGAGAYLAERQVTRAATEVKQRVLNRLYRRLQLLLPAGIAGEDAGTLAEIVTSGVEGLESYLTRFLPHLFLAALLPLLVLTVVFPVEWRAGIVLLFSAPFIPLMMVLIGKGAERLNREQWGKLTRMAGHLLDLVQGLPDLKIFGAARREAAMVAAVSDDYRRSTMAVLRIAFLSALMLEFFATVGTALVAVIIGFLLLSGKLALVDGLFVLLLAPEFYLPLRTLGLSWHSRMNGTAAAARILPLMLQPLPLPESGDLPPPESAPEIHLDKVSFCYGADRGGVRDIDLVIPPESVTVIVGESGSGKSTLARLLLGLSLPEQGRVLVDGHDLASYDQGRWRERLAWVPQRPFFAATSIRENLLAAGRGATDADISAALEAAALSEVVARLPQGVDTQLGDRGAGLSGGELRRLALARLMLRKPLLIVLDEPTAGLDQANERLILDTIQRLAIGRTMIIISHREETLRNCTQVVQLASGRLTEISSGGVLS